MERDYYAEVREILEDWLEQSDVNIDYIEAQLEDIVENLEDI